MPGPLMTRTSTQGLLGVFRYGRKTIVQAATRIVFIVDTAVDARPSPTRRARGNATMEYAWLVSCAAVLLRPRHSHRLSASLPRPPQWSVKRSHPEDSIRMSGESNGRDQCRVAEPSSRSCARLKLGQR